MDGPAADQLRATHALLVREEGPAAFDPKLSKPNCGGVLRVVGTVPPLSTVVLDVLHFSLHAAAFHSAVCSHPGRIVQLKNVGVEPCDALMLAGSTLEDAEAAKNAGVDSLDLRQLSMGAKASDCVNPFGNDPTLAGAGYAGSVSNRRLTLQWGRGVALCRRCSQAERGPELRRAWQPPPRHPLLGGQG